MNNIEEMLIFAKVVELGSFSRAADALKVSKSHVSKKITKFETSLEQQLLSRNTRGMNLTEAGKIYYGYCQKLSDDVEHANNRLAEYKGEAAGQLRITTPPGFAVAILNKMIPVFLKMYPDIEIVLDTDRHYINIIRDGYDLAIRSRKGNLADSELVAKRLTRIHQVLCATPQFIAHYGEIDDPKEIIDYPMMVSDDVFNEWQFQNNKEIINISLTGNLHCSDALVFKDLLLKGHHAGILPDYMVWDEILQGALVQLLPLYQLENSYLYAIYPKREYLPKKLTLFLEALQQNLVELRQNLTKRADDTYKH